MVIDETADTLRSVRFELLGQDNSQLCEYYGVEVASLKQQAKERYRHLRLRVFMAR